MAVAITAGTNFDRARNPHPHPTDFAHEIRIQQMRILAGSVTCRSVNQQSGINHNPCKQRLLILLTMKSDHKLIIWAQIHRYSLKIYPKMCHKICGPEVLFQDLRRDEIRE